MPETPSMSVMMWTRTAPLCPAGPAPRAEALESWDVDDPALLRGHPDLRAGLPAPGRRRPAGRRGPAVHLPARRVVRGLDGPGGRPDDVGHDRHPADGGERPLTAAAPP